MREGLIEGFGGILGCALILAGIGTMIMLISFPFVLFWKKHFIGWILIVLFSPLFWVIGYLFQGWSGQFCQNWKGLNALLERASTGTLFDRLHLSRRWKTLPVLFR